MNKMFLNPERKALVATKHHSNYSPNTNHRTTKFIFITRFCSQSDITNQKANFRPEQSKLRFSQSAITYLPLTPQTPRSPQLIEIPLLSIPAVIVNLYNSDFSYRRPLKRGTLCSSRIYLD